MATALYSERFQIDLDNAPIAAIAAEVDLIILAAAQLFLTINEFKEDPHVPPKTRSTRSPGRVWR